MKKIFIPVIVLVLILAVVAIILSKTTSADDVGYHTHEDGSTHYDVETTTYAEYHTHADGVTHFGED